MEELVKKLVKEEVKKHFEREQSTVSTTTTSSNNGRDNTGRTPQVASRLNGLLNRINRIQHRSSRKLNHPNQ